jgi:hypothetical protein
MSGEQAQPCWYLAELVMEITVSGASRNVVHRDLFLVSAADAEEAHQKAMLLGSRGEISYDNPQGQRVDFKFRGIANLDSIIDGTLEDGSELAFAQDVDVSEERIQQWVRSKENLGAFFEPDPSRKFDPDYSSGEIMRELAEFLRRQEPEAP